MRVSSSTVWVVAAAMTILATVTASAQPYPSKPIRVVSPAGGGGGDVVARLLANGLAERVAQQVVIDNRPSGIIMGQIVAKAAPDGYTLLFAGSTHWLSPFMVTRTNSGFDPVKDFSPIALATSSPNIVVVTSSLGVKSIKDLIALAKAKPGELNYGRAGAGGSSHISAELFKAMAAVNIVSVPYKGSGPALIGLLSGQVQVIFATAPTVAPHVKSGKLNALAVTTAQPSALFPGLATVAASGVPGYESATIYGFLAPVRTSAAVIRKLNQEIGAMLAGPEMKEKLLNAGVEPAGGTPPEFAAKIRAEMTLLGKLIKDAAISAE